MAIEKQAAATEWDGQDWGVSIRGLSYEEGFAVLDKQARRRLNMSGEEILETWRADAFTEAFMDEHHSAFAYLSILVLPFVK
jgi:hypothetical protein